MQITFKHSILLFICFHFHIISAISQEYVVSGIIVEKGTDLPLIGATVLLANRGTITDANGLFELKVPEGNHEIKVNYLGYSDHIQLLVVSENKNLEIVLSQSENILDVTTVTGSKYEKNISKSAVSINVIKPRLIQNTNMTKMDQLLDRIPGVQMIDGQANIRGGSGYSYGAGSRVLLLIDDVPALQADAGRPLWDDIPVENVAQVEVLKGASSALYGSAAMNGIINIRTGYATSTPTTSVFTSYTSYDDPKDERKKWWTETPTRINAGLVHKRKIDKLDMVVAGFYENLDSYYQDVFKKRLRASGNFKYRLSPQLTIGMNVMYNYKDDGSYLLWDDATSGAYQGWDGTFTAGVTKRFYVDPQIDYTTQKGGRHKLISRYYWLQNSSSTQQATASDNYYLEYQYHKELSKWNTRLVSGASGYFVNSNSELYGNIDLSSKNFAAFLQLEKSFSDKLDLTIGTRLESNIQTNPSVFLGDTLRDIRQNETRSVSRLGLNYELRKGTYLRGSIGQGYRFPTLAERFIFTRLGALNILPNPSLGSETGWTAEVGVKQLVSIGTTKAYLDLALFRSKYNNMMEFVFGQYGDDIGFQSQNVGDISIFGYEVNLIGETSIYDFPIKVLSGYTFIEPKYLEISEAFESTISQPIVDGEDPLFLKYRNRHNVKADIEVELYGFTLGYTYNYTSPTVTMDQFLENLNEIEQYRKLNNKGYTKMDCRLSYKFKFAKLAFLAENFMNTEYVIRPGILEAPRNYSLRLDLEF